MTALLKNLLALPLLCSNLNTITLISKGFIEPGPISMGNSYQCELSGLLAMVYLSNILCHTYHITEGSILVVWNKKTALKSLSAMVYTRPQCWFLWFNVRLASHPCTIFSQLDYTACIWSPRLLGTTPHTPWTTKYSNGYSGKQVPLYLWKASTTSPPNYPL